MVRAARCSISGCNGRSNNGEEVKSFRFPTNEIMKIKWVNLCGRKDIFNADTGRICSLHFSPEQYSRDLMAELLGDKYKKSKFKRTLKEDALPDLNLPENIGECVENDFSKVFCKEDNMLLIKDKHKEQKLDKLPLTKPSSLEVNETSFKPELLHDNQPVVPVDKSEMNTNMVSIGTQTEETEHEPPISLFVCTFHSDNSVETFCDLKTEAIYPMEESYDIFKTNIMKANSKVKDNYKKRKKCVAKKNIKLEDELDDHFDMDNFDHDYDDLSDEEPITKKKKKPVKRVSKLCTLCTTRRDKRMCFRFANHTENNFGCKFCHMSFSSLNPLCHHANQEHSAEILQMFSHRCGLCRQLFTSEENYTNHTKGHKCEECNQVIYCQNKLTVHRRKAHPATCDICQEVCKNIVKLSEHKLAHEVEQGKNVLKCNACNQLFVRQEHLNKHTKSMSCKICLQSFNCIKRLKTHRYVSHPRFQCNICLRRFPFESVLKEHMGNHSMTDKFLCDICDKTFASKKKVMYHKRNFHKLDSKFQCEVCSKIFYYKSFLDMHMRIHTDDKPFMCETCGSMFKHNSALKRHVKRIHGISSSLLLMPMQVPREPPEVIMPDLYPKYTSL